MKNKEYNRLLKLKRLINSNQATKTEEREYIELMYSNNRISKTQYDNYISNKNADAVLQATLTIGGVLLATWLINKLLSE